MVTESPAVTVGASRWHVTFGSDGEGVALRDYFRRLGLVADLKGPATIELVAADADDHDIPSYVDSWTTINQVAVEFRRADMPMPFLLPPPGPPRLGELLVRRGLISEADLSWAIGEARATGTLLGLVLLRERLIFEDELARALSEQFEIPYINIGVIGVNPSVARLLPASVGAAAAAIPIRWVGDAILVGFADPTDPQALAAVTEHLPNLATAVVELTEIKLAWREINAA
jgi:hypothetical protein